jgi:hypothetical protein
MIETHSPGWQFFHELIRACGACTVPAATLYPDGKSIPLMGRNITPITPSEPQPFCGHRRLGSPPADSRFWENVLKARQVALAIETRQINAALADDVPAFVRTVYQQARDTNQLAFTSAVFGVQSCTFY